MMNAESKPHTGNALAVASLILGVASSTPVAITLFFYIVQFYTYLDYILHLLGNYILVIAGTDVVAGLIAVTMGAIALKQTGWQNPAGRKTAKAGLLLGAFGAVAILLITWFIIEAFSHFTIL